MSPEFWKWNIMLSQNWYKKYYNSDFFHFPEQKVFSNFLKTLRARFWAEKENAVLGKKKDLTWNLSSLKIFSKINYFSPFFLPAYTIYFIISWLRRKKLIWIVIKAFLFKEKFTYFFFLEKTRFDGFFVHQPWKNHHFLKKNRSQVDVVFLQNFLKKKLLFSSFSTRLYN